VVSILAATTPKIIYNYYNPIPVIKEFKAPVHTKIVKNKIVKHKKVSYSLPKDIKVLGIAERVASETNYPIELISKIMFAESHYDINAKHINKNGSIDSGLFQINSQHIPLAKKMGIDIMTPDGNAEFAIYLIKKNGLRDWGYSKYKWSVL
jgi:hypothetical protein